MIFSLEGIFTNLKRYNYKPLSNLVELIDKDLDFEEEFEKFESFF
jgi:hypothetical protein